MILDVKKVYGNAKCHCGGNKELFFQQIQSWWIPWVLNERVLLAGVLMAACRSLITIDIGRSLHAMLLLQYKSECIALVQRGLTPPSGVVVSDATIAATLLLASEEVRL